MARAAAFAAIVAGKNCAYKGGADLCAAFIEDPRSVASGGGAVLVRVDIVADVPTFADQRAR